MFDVTNAGDITIRIVLNRRDVSGQDLQIHTSEEQSRPTEQDLRQQQKIDAVFSAHRQYR
jgi:hypothetical protein